MNIYFALSWMLFFLVVGLAIGMRWGVGRFMAETSRKYNLFARLTNRADRTRSVNKFLLGQIRGFKKAGGELLSLTIKSLDSIDRDKLRIIRRFRSLLTWAEKYVAVSK